MELELRHLKMLEVLAREGSISGAARNLGVTQPALSRTLRRIESEFGASLLIRTAEGIRLTEAGVLAVEGAADIRRAFDDMLAKVRDMRPASARTVRVASDGFAYRPITDFFYDRGFDTQYSMVLEPDTFTMVERRQLDLALVYYDLTSTYQPAPGIRSAFVMNTAMWAVLGEGHPFANEEVVPLARLAADGWLLKPRGNLRRRLDQACGKAGFQPRPAFVGPNGLFADYLVEGRGVTIGEPSSTPFDPPGLVYRRLDEDILAPLHVIWRADVVASTTVESLIDHLCEHNRISSRTHAEFWKWRTGTGHSAPMYAKV